VVRKYLYLALILTVAFGVNACAPAAEPVTPTKTIVAVEETATISSPTKSSCKPTLDDGVSPSYMPDTPERTIVGHGHILTGVVLSNVDCQPIPHAKLEFWPEEEGLGHPESSRATFYTDKNGEYRFECNLPEHIHMRISADGYKTIGVNSYHPEGAPEGVFDIVLEPAP
jgi:protocatechuate 3,4-dioxygenase beta subunit